jgi:hypothetical protein
MSPETAKTIIVVCANEQTQAGEKAYAQAIAAFISDQAYQNTPHIFIKDAQGETTNTLSGYSLPLTNSDYAQMPSWHNPETNIALQNILSKSQKNPITIIGAGHSTLKTTLQVAKQINNYGATAITIGFISHLLNEQEIATCAANNVMVFAPINLPSEHSDTLQLTQINRVPDTNTSLSQAINYKSLLNTPNGQKIKNWHLANQPMCGVVLNAGVTVDGTRVPYTSIEAYTHAHALGSYLKPNTALFLAHGGPRNLSDEAAGQNNTDLFVAGYLNGQNRQVANYNTAKSLANQNPLTPHNFVVIERFSTGLDYDAVKAMAHMVKTHDNLQYAVSNAEGFSTIDMMVRACQGTKKTVGVFNFQANQIQVARRENTEKYYTQGMALFLAAADNLIIQKHPTPQLPDDTDPVAKIFKTLNLIA